MDRVGTGHFLSLGRDGAPFCISATIQAVFQQKVMFRHTVTLDGASVTGPELVNL